MLIVPLALAIGIPSSVAVSYAHSMFFITPEVISSSVSAQCFLIVTWVLFSIAVVPRRSIYGLPQRSRTASSVCIMRNRDPVAYRRCEKTTYMLRSTLSQAQQMRRIREMEEKMRREREAHQVEFGGFGGSVHCLTGSV